MNVLYTCDDNYVWIMGISLISLYENNKNITSLNVYFLGENIRQSNKNTLYSIASKYGRTLNIIDVPHFDIPKSIVSARWPLSAFTRLFAGELLPNDVSRILYLDCDTIICGNLQYLETVKMEDAIFMGVKDCIGPVYKKNIGLSAKSVYINAGVLLINLDKLRKVNIRLEINNYMNQYEKLIAYADQDLLNGIFNSKVGILPPQFDVMTIDVAHSYKDILKLRRPTNFCREDELLFAIKNPKIIHYTTNMLVVRPWYKNSDHPLKGYFSYYKARSPWNNHTEKEMIFGRDAKIIKIIDLFPKAISYRILGLIHSYLKPMYMKIKAKHGK